MSKLVDIPVNAALGVEIQGITVEQWDERGKMVVLAAFTMGKALPEKSFETKVQERFQELRNAGLGGRPISVEIQATLAPVP